MQGRMNEIHASQKRMLIRRGELTDDVNNEKLSELFEKHLAKTEKLLEEKCNFAVIVNREKYIDDVNQFLRGVLNTDSFHYVTTVCINLNSNFKGGTNNGGRSALTIISIGDPLPLRNIIPSYSGR